MTVKLNAWPGYMSHVLMFFMCFVKKPPTVRIQLPATSDYRRDWNAQQQQWRPQPMPISVVMSQLHFPVYSHLLSLKHHGVLIPRLTAAGRRSVEVQLVYSFPTLRTFCTKWKTTWKTWASCSVVISDTHVKNVESQSGNCVTVHQKESTKVIWTSTPMTDQDYAAVNWKWMDGPIKKGPWVLQYSTAKDDFMGIINEP